MPDDDAMYCSECGKEIDHHDEVSGYEDQVFCSKTCEDSYYSGDYSENSYSDIARDGRWA